MLPDYELAVASKCEEPRPEIVSSPDGVGNSIPDCLSSDPHRIVGWEYLFLCVIGLTTFGLRFAFPDRLGVEHFDEGVYASNIWFGNGKSAGYPEQHLFAPPLVPMLIEFTFLVTGPSNQWAMFPSQLMGALTPLVLWWLGREWFGQVAACVAATLCALSDVHILLSRSALTDVPLGLWWVLAMLTLRDACTSGRFLSGVVAGYCVGVAWWTKYNGWMPLGIAFGAIVLRGFVLGRLHDSRVRQITFTAIRGWMIATMTAILIWLPWVWCLQSRGGYSAVTTNHRRYLVGLEGWQSSFARQASQLFSLSGLLTTLSVFLTIVLVPLIASRVRTGISLSSQRNVGGLSPSIEGKPQPRLFASMVFSGWASCIFHVGFCVWSLCSTTGVTILGLANWCGRLSSTNIASGESKRTDLGGWFLLVWFLGLSISTPLYHPYLRLTIPWLLASFLGAGLFAQQNCRRRANPQREAGVDSAIPPTPLSIYSDRILAGCLLLTIATVAYPTWVATRHALNPAIAFPERTELWDAAQMIKQVVEPVADTESNTAATAVYVFAEPALLFQLRLAGLPHVVPAGSLKFAETRIDPQHRIFLAIGIHAKQDSEFVEQFNRQSHRFKRVVKWPWRLSPLVSLDQPKTRPELLGQDPNEMGAVELFEVTGE